MILFTQLVLVVCCFVHRVLSQAFGPTTISQWTVDGLSQFTAVSPFPSQLTLILLTSHKLSFTVTIPTAVPWTTKGAAFSIQPNLFNGDVNNWVYYDNIAYSNTTGTPANPEIYKLSFNAGQVNSVTKTVASPTSKTFSLSQRVILPAMLITLSLSRRLSELFVCTKVWHNVGPDLERRSRRHRKSCWRHSELRELFLHLPLATLFIPSFFVLQAKHRRD